MTVNQFTDNTDINVYFHMKNHYKKLRNVKSVIDTSAPQGFIKSTSTPPISDRSWKTCSYEERHAKDCSHIPNHSNFIKRHDCITSDPKSNGTARSTSTPTRPKTRRHPYEMPNKSQWKSRSQSAGRTSKKDVATELHNSRIKKKRKAVGYGNFGQEIKSENVSPKEMTVNEFSSGETNRSTQMTSRTSEKIVSKSRTEEHEYLQFLLRITEDIIINNFYTSEDVDKVFQNHIEANKDRLKMEKMEAQLDRLCKELHIPYKTVENGVKNEKCYPNFFNNNQHISRYSQHFENCECGTRRSLEVSDKCDKKINTVIEEKDSPESCLIDEAFSSSLTMLLNKRSLGRVTECTEPTNSIETFTSSLKQPSITTVSSFENVAILPCFENTDSLYPISQGETNNSNQPEKASNFQQENSNLFDNDIPLTEKEKIGCVEENIMFDKLYIRTNSNQPTTLDVSKNENDTPISNIRIDEKTISAFSEKNFEDKCEETNDLNKIIFEVSNVLKEEYTSTFHVDTNEFPTIVNNMSFNINEIAPKIEENRQESEEMSTESIHMIQEKILDDILSNTFDKGTQIEISHCDKECNTEKELEEYSISDDYVLVNGPVYVLKTVLNTKENIILHDTRHTVNKHIPEKLIENETASLNNLYSTGYNSEPLYRREIQFSKLLNSDYDLTPQRDDNTSEKYHHLLVDAATSITNLSATTVAVSNLKPDALLLTENYSVPSKKSDEDFGPPSERKLDGEESETFCDQKNSYLFSTNELSSDGQYEIKSYTMPKEVNGCVRLSGYSISSQAEKDEQLDELTELDVSLTAYEIKSEISDLGKEENKDVTKDASQLGEMADVNVADEDSQVSSFRSEKSQSSTTSTTYTKNILGKRKLSHPS